MDTNPVSVKEKHYSDTVTAYILQNNYDARDIDYLLEVYESFGKQTQRMVFEMALNHIQNVLSILHDVDRQLLSALLITDNVDLDSKKTIFKTLALKASDAEIKQWLPCVANRDFLALYEKNKRPRFDKTVWNEDLLEILKERGLIADYNFNETIQKFTIRRRKKLFPL